MGNTVIKQYSGGEMINFYTKRRRTKTIKEIFLLWFESCFSFINMHKLYEPRPKIGAICFFIGSLDSLCQSLSIDDITFAKLNNSIFNKVGFYPQIVLSIVVNYFGKGQHIEFATQAMKIGGKEFSVWYNSSFLETNSVKKLSILIDEWNSNPTLLPNEIRLLGIQ